jgi:hypothetical protein
MKDNCIHLSDAEMDDLLTTAEVSGLEIEDVISTAAWTFARNEDNFKSFYIREILFNNGGKGIEKPRPRKTISMGWRVVSFPSSARMLLRREHQSDFSPLQKIRVAIAYFLGMPLERRICLAHEHAAQIPTETAAGTPMPD